MGNIKLIEYNEQYAAKLADMWNKSGDGWFGFENVETEATVRESEKKNGNLKTFLAMDNDEVVGYCSFSEYRQDEGASYLPTLNVRPDYHGKKVGKMLVKRVVEEAINERWPRFDLYTWPGNTKAMPLYKKCGFFWEKEDASTHLMNFIPYMMKTEAVKDYFCKLDWYDDSKRKIELKRDGMEEKNTDFYEYMWEKDGIYLKANFEKKGRGLSLLENNDYKIECLIEDHELIFGKEYEVTYRIENKSGKELNIEIEGEDNKNIQFNFHKLIKVDEVEGIKAKFFVDKPLNKVARLRTYPSLNSILKINGKNAKFKLGIDAKYPVDIEFKSLERPYFQGNEEVLYMEVENNFEEDIVLRVNFGENEILDFNNTNVEVLLKSKERNSIEIPCKIKGLGFYKEDLKVTVETEKESIKFNKEISCAIRGYSQKFYGENEEEAFIFNGEYKVKLIKRINEVQISGYESTGADEIDNFIMHPKVGMPYSLELSKKRPNEVVYGIENDYVLMKIRYDLEDFKGLRLWNEIKLFANGIMENNYELENISMETKKDIKLVSSYYNDFKNLIMPYNGKVLEMRDSNGDDVSYWDQDEITENWLFFDNYEVKMGVVFEDNRKVKLDQWYFYDEYDFGDIKPGERIKNASVYVCCNTFNTWESLRRFALKGKIEKDLEKVNHIDININNNNPFVSEYIDLSLQQYSKRNNEELITVINKEGIKDQCKNLKVTVDKLKNMEMLKVKVDLKTAAFTKEYVAFVKKNEKIEAKEEKEHGMNVITLKNNHLEIKAVPEYAPGIASVSFKDNNWIESGFPVYEPRGAYNPWLGGVMFYNFGYIKPDSLIKEERKAEIVELEDNFKNVWKGIKSSLYIKNIKKFSGLTVNQYSMMIPGVPVICELIEIENNTGKYITDEIFSSDKWVKYGESQKSGSMIAKHENGETLEYKCATGDIGVLTKRLVAFKSKERVEKMHVYASSNRPSICTMSDNKHDIVEVRYALDIKHGYKQLLPLNFIIFSEEELSREMLRKLDNIKFEL